MLQTLPLVAVFELLKCWRSSNSGVASRTKNFRAHPLSSVDERLRLRIVAAGAYQEIINEIEV